MWNNTRKDKVQADFFVKKTNNAFFSLILDGDKSNDKLSSTYMLINLLKKLFFNNNKYKNSINMFIEHDEIYFLSLKKINSIPINLRSGTLNMAIQGMNDKSLLLVLCSIIAIDYSSISTPSAKFFSFKVVSVMKGTIGLTSNNSLIGACSMCFFNFGKTSFK